MTNQPDSSMLLLTLSVTGAFKQELMIFKSNVTKTQPILIILEKYIITQDTLFCNRRKKSHLAITNILKCCL